MTRGLHLNVAAIDELIQQAQNSLEAARHHVDSTAMAAAYPGGDEKAPLLARDAVCVLESKLRGLALLRDQELAAEQRRSGQ